MYSRKKRRHITFTGGTRSQQRLTRGQAHSRGIRLQPPLESATRHRKANVPQKQAEAPVDAAAEAEYAQNEDAHDSSSMEMLPERILNRQSNRDYVPVFISQSRRLQRQKKFRSKRRKCKKSAILLDVEENCDPMLVPVNKDPVKGDYIVLQDKRVRLKSKFLRGRYRNLQNMTLIQIPQVSQHSLHEPIVEINEENTTPEEFSDILSNAASHAAAAATNQVFQIEEDTHPQEQEKRPAKSNPKQKNTITYRYEKVGNDGDVNIYINDKLEFLVRDSAFLKAINIPNQKGLYTARARHKGDILGRYSGKVLGRAGDKQTEKLMDKVPDSRYMLTILPYRGENLVIDGAQPLQTINEQEQVLKAFKKKQRDGSYNTRIPPPLSLMEYPYPGICAPLMNDAAGPKRVEQVENNVIFTQNGSIKAIKNIKAFDPSKEDILQNLGSELLVSYGEGYWEDLDANKINTGSVDFCKAIPGQTVASSKLFQVKQK